jgi:hypothetical protein
MRTIVDWLPKNHEALYDKATLTRDYLIDTTKPPPVPSKGGGAKLPPL